MFSLVTWGFSKFFPATDSSSGLWRSCSLPCFFFFLLCFWFASGAVCSEFVIIVELSTWPLSSPFFFSLRLFVLALLIPDWFTPAVVSRSEAIPSLSVQAWQVGSVLLWHRLSLTPFIWSFFLCSLLSSSSLWLINMSFFSFLLLRRFNFLLHSCSRAFSTGPV